MKNQQDTMKTLLVKKQNKMIDPMNGTIKLLLILLAVCAFDVYVVNPPNDANPDTLTVEVK